MSYDQSCLNAQTTQRPHLAPQNQIHRLWVALHDRIMTIHSCIGTVIDLQAQKPVEPGALAVTNFVRHNALLKQRPGVLGGKRQDFFRVKRLVRALLSPEYAKAQAKSKSLMPKVTNHEEAIDVFRTLLLNRMAVRVQKLRSEDSAKIIGIKSIKGVPTLQVVHSQEYEGDMYYAWLHEPVSIMTYVYAGAAVAAVFAVVLFPLWPQSMRTGVYFLSLGLFGVFGLFFVITIVRTILFLVTYVAVSPGIWLFPNLFADVGVIDSFIPLYSWRGQKVPKGRGAQQKFKKRLKSTTKSNSSAASSTASSPNAEKMALIESKIQAFPRIADAAKDAPPGTPAHQKLLAHIHDLESLGLKIQFSPPDEEGKSEVQFQLRMSDVDGPPEPTTEISVAPRKTPSKKVVLEELEE